MTQEKTFKERVIEHIKRHSHSIIIQTVAFSLITGFAIYEIRQTRNHVQNKFDRSYGELEEFSKLQARRIEYLAAKVKVLGKMALVPVDAASDAYQKMQNYYKELKESAANTDLWPDEYYEALKNKIETSDWIKGGIEEKKESEQTQ